MSNKAKPKDVSSLEALFLTLGSRLLRPAAFISTISVIRNFFLLQYRGAARPHYYRVSSVDHILDQKIPFKPLKVKAYADFIYFFIRACGLLIKYCKTLEPGRQKKAMMQINEFVKSLGATYTKAAEVYIKNFSTTKRPKYLLRFEFIVIHIFDPHLMCIPSLHVMVVILSFTRLQKILQELGADDSYITLTEAYKKRALEITEAVLYIKQHSINCISAAMYAMSCFDDLFPEEKAKAFAKDIFLHAKDILPKDREAIINHIIELYGQFYNQYLNEGQKQSAWSKPLLDFLKNT